MPRYFLPRGCLFAVLMAAAGVDAGGLHYFRDHAARTVGVKNSAGRIIVPAHYADNGWAAYDQTVCGTTVEMAGSIHERRGAETQPAAAAGDVYDAQGRYLYSPLAYDNGFDDWAEGMRRFVENGKVGFVDRSGRKTVAARYAFAEPFTYGYAVVYIGNWRRKYGAGGEHWTLEAADSAAAVRVIDRSGREIAGSAVRGAPQDVYLDGRYFPDPFVYNETERRIPARLQPVADILADLKASRFSNTVSDVRRRVQAAIVARPSFDVPFYEIGIFTGVGGAETAQRETDFHLFADRSGKIVYRDPYCGSLAVPFKSWLLEQLHETDAAFRGGLQNTPNRFDVGAAVRRVQKMKF